MKPNEVIALTMCLMDKAGDEPMSDDEWVGLKKQAYMSCADNIVEALKEAGYVVAPAKHVNELCGDVEAYVNDQYAGDHPVYVKKREIELNHVRQVRAMIKEQGE